MITQDGLKWTEGIFGPQPEWTKEPDIEVIKTLTSKSLQLDEAASCEVTFHAEGGFNKLYEVAANGTMYMFRVALPVDPHHKTMSEVATIEFVRANTDMPVPNIYAFDASNENELGFEWILMEMMPGRPLRLLWRKLSMETKEALVKELVRYQVQLFNKPFDEIGNIYQQSSSNPVETIQSQTETCRIGSRHDGKNLGFTLGWMVWLIFSWSKHIFEDVPRGPFPSANDWLRPRISLLAKDQDRALAELSDEEEIEEVEKIQSITKRFLQHLDTVFPPGESEATVLFHDDLSMQNILVDDSGNITAVIDWECVSTLPLWRACQIPVLLEGREREEEPKKDQYVPPGSDNDDVLDDEGVGILYWEHLLEFEQTQLRKLFVTEMGRLQPAWVDAWKNSTLKVDFEAAVHDCGDMFKSGLIIRWLNCYEKGDYWGYKAHCLD